MKKFQFNKFENFDFMYQFSYCNFVIDYMITRKWVCQLASGDSSRSQAV